MQRARAGGRAGGCRAVLVAAAVVALACVRAPAQGEGSEGGEGGEGEADPLARVAELLPEGRVQRGVTVPGMEEGRLASLVSIDELERLDGRTLRMSGVVISQFQGGQEVMRVSMARGLYDLETGLLRSESRALVQKLEMDIEGEVLVYDSKSRAGKLEGDVETLIYQLEDDDDEEEEE